MAAITVATGYPLRESCGSLTLHIVKSTADDGDTFASGLGSNVVGYWANSETNETAGEEGVNVTNSSGTFTLGLKTAASTVTLYILSRS